VLPVSGPVTGVLQIRPASPRNYPVSEGHRQIISRMFVRMIEDRRDLTTCLSKKISKPDYGEQVAFATPFPGSLS
jgi:hypothetical protein